MQHYLSVDFTVQEQKNEITEPIIEYMDGFCNFQYKKKNIHPKDARIILYRWYRKIFQNKKCLYQDLIDSILLYLPKYKQIQAKYLKKLVKNKKFIRKKRRKKKKLNS